MTAINLQDEDLLKVLREGKISLEGQFYNSSNYTFLVTVNHGEEEVLAVYKPMEGERPLWDFPEGTLVNREMAAYEVSQALGWCFVPPTVLREEAPYGPGSLQVFIQHDPEITYFNLTDEEKQQLRPVVAFDVLVNNADRKGGHIILDGEDRFWLIDHGVCFHEIDKLRTVIWDFAGEPVPEDIKSIVHRFIDELDQRTGLYEKLLGLLSQREVNALIHRSRQFLDVSRFPLPSDTRRPYPWPPV